MNAKVDSELIVPIDNPQNKISTNNQLTRDVIFKISEKSKVTINKIHFEGNNSFSDFRLRWQMKETKQQPFYMFWRSNFDNSSFKEDIDLLSTFYRNKGYRDFEVLKV